MPDDVQGSKGFRSLSCPHEQLGSPGGDRTLVRPAATQGSKDLVPAGDTPNCLSSVNWFVHLLSYGVVACGHFNVDLIGPHESGEDRPDVRRANRFVGVRQEL